MSGGEALLNKTSSAFAPSSGGGYPDQFIVDRAHLAKHAGELVKWVDDIIVSLD